MPEQSVYIKLNGKVNRRTPFSEGKSSDPTLRENMLSRNGIVSTVPGTEKALTNTLEDRITWMGRYHTIETGIVNPKTFLYTKDGRLWHVDDNDGVATEAKAGLNVDAYPNSWLFKKNEQNFMYFVDGLNLYKHDGNNDQNFDLVTITDTDGNTINPIDVIEHRDRLILISETFVYISKNLEPDIFNDATDSIQIITGSGKGKNLALGKIEDNLYIFTTEGIFVLAGDVISAVASTFEVRLVDDRRIISGRSRTLVEKAIVFLADDYNIWSWDGVTTTKLSHDEKIEDFVNTKRVFLDKAVAIYEDNYYKLSVVEKGQGENKLEFWWDAFENKIDFIKGRNVSYYMQTDPTVEDPFSQFARSDVNYTMWPGRGATFDGVTINQRIRSRDITFSKGRNVRISALRPEIQLIGPLTDTKQTLTMKIRYLLDGRLSNPSGANAFDNFSLDGETYDIGQISIVNQNQTTGRFRPKINYARASSIAVEILDEDTANLRFQFIGILITFVDKKMKKGRKIGA